uniref:Aspartic protease pep1 n=1 Tax=Talaromyces marneffei PM1 TaxID=1077442 RepID=A0A093XET0_TALMA
MIRVLLDRSLSQDSYPVPSSPPPLVDSGSGNLWAYTPQTPAVGSHATYNPQTGTVLEGFYWEVINGQGVITQGRVVLDKVSVGRLTSPLQAVQLVDSIEPISAMHNPMRAHDGVLGIALSKRNAVRPIKQRTFFDNIKNNLAAPLIAAYIKHGAPGTYDIGWIDTTNSTPFFAVVDTGASLILLQNSIVAQYYDKIPGAYISPVRGGYVFPCTDTDIIPDFTLNLGEFNTTIPGYLLKYATYGDHCFGGIQISPVPSYNFLGDVFLKRHYVIFSSYSHGPRIGIAAQA